MRCEALCAILRPDPGTSRLRMPDRPVRLSQARFCRSGWHLGSHPGLPFAVGAACVACGDGSTAVGAGADRGLLGHQALLPVRSVIWTMSAVWSTVGNCGLGSSGSFAISTMVLPG